MIADLLPPPVRRAVYVALTTAFAVEAIWDVVPSGVESRLLATCAVLGFALAARNTPKAAED